VRCIWKIGVWRRGWVEERADGHAFFGEWGGFDFLFLVALLVIGGKGHFRRGGTGKTKTSVL